jgi:hypothetical protein
VKVLASGAMIALFLGLVAGWAERPRAATNPVMEGPRIIVDSAAEVAPGS